jgi:hypothetical protein
MRRIVSTPEELAALRPRAARRGVDRLVLQLGMHDGESRRVEQQLNRFLASCGCETGAAFVIIGLAIQIAVAVATSDGISWPGLATVGRFSLVLLGLGLAGKITGLVAAEWRFRRAIDATVRKVTALHLEPSTN